jgi:ribonuclease P protein component
VYRLQKQADFQRLREAGRAYRHPWMTLSVVVNALAYSRYGFITNKQLGKAVIRNRVRRLLREAVRFRAADIRPGFDILLIARPAMVGKPFQEVQQVVNDLIKQARLLERGELT